MLMEKKDQKRIEHISLRRKQQLIDATIKCLNTYGYAQATTRNISKIAGVSKGVLQHHFSGKEDLLVTSMKYLIKEILQSVRDILKEGDSALENSRKIILALLKPSSLEYGEFKAWMVFWTESMSNKELERYLNIYNRRILSNLTHELARVFDRETAQYLAQIFFSLANGLWIEMCTSGKEEYTKHLNKAEKLFDELTQLYLLRNLLNKEQTQEQTKQGN